MRALRCSSERQVSRRALHLRASEVVIAVAAHYAKQQAREEDAQVLDEHAPGSALPFRVVVLQILNQDPRGPAERAKHDDKGDRHPGLRLHPGPVAAEPAIVRDGLPLDDVEHHQAERHQDAGRPVRARLHPINCRLVGGL